jgi:hypothetical protein
MTIFRIWQDGSKNGRMPTSTSIMTQVGLAIPTSGAVCIFKILLCVIQHQQSLFRR